MELEEDIIMESFHQEVHNENDTSWNGKHIQKNKFKEGYLVLLYDSEYLNHLGKLIMHWLGPYQINSITDGGFFQLQDLVGKEFQGFVNGR